MKRFSALLAVASLLAGCGSLPASLITDDESRQVADLIAYALRTGAFSPDDQRRELNDANKAYAADQGDYPRLRLALLLSLPGTSITDEARAAALLDPSAEEANGAEPGALRQFGRLLHAQANGRLRESRKATLLKEQIDALREIDREQKRPRQVADLIAYALRTSALSPDDQRRELKDANKAYAADQGDYPRLRLALLLSLPGTSITDEARAAALLDPSAERTNGAEPGALRQFGRLLHAQVSGRLREHARRRS